jgi:hypothetical protein
MAIAVSRPIFLFAGNIRARPRHSVYTPIQAALGDVLSREGIRQGLIPHFQGKMADENMIGRAFFDF